MKFVIEKNIKPKSPAAGEFLNVLLKMDVGDSFVIAKEKAQSIRTNINLLQKKGELLGKTFAVRKSELNDYRCFRTK